MPAELPHLYIPANVPWKLKRIGNLKQNAFQIVVPPTMDDNIDRRVKVMSSKPKNKNTKEVTTRLSFDEDVGPGASLKSFARSNSWSKKCTQIFSFQCESPQELAVYSDTAQTLGRHSEMQRRVPFSLPRHNSLRRVAEGKDAAGRASLMHWLGSLGSSKHLIKVPKVRSMSFRATVFFFDPVTSTSSFDLWQKKIRYRPLHAYPNTWLTKKELAEDMIRTSTKFCDLRNGSPEEIGSVRIEVSTSSLCSVQFLLFCNFSLSFE